MILFGSIFELSSAELPETEIALESESYKKCLGADLNFAESAHKILWSLYVFHDNILKSIYQLEHAQSLMI